MGPVGPVCWNRSFKNRRTRNLYNFIKQLKTVHSLDIINVIDIIIMEFNTPNGEDPQQRGVDPVGWNTSFSNCKCCVKTTQFYIYRKDDIRTPALACIPMERRRGARGLE